jgi:hypothetical protein
MVLIKREAEEIFEPVSAQSDTAPAKVRVAEN